jgi:hypothetical protein
MLIVEQRTRRERCKETDLRPGEKIGRLTVLGKAERINGSYASICKCECEKIIARRNSTLRMARDQNMEASCGCARNQGGLKKKIEDAVALRHSKLTPEEFAQVDRICAERRKPCRRDRAEAVLCVIADRPVGEMVCHQGATETI